MGSFNEVLNYTSVLGFAASQRDVCFNVSVDKIFYDRSRRSFDD